MSCFALLIVLPTLLNQVDQACAKNYFL